jgi:hypothetical protein
VTKGPLLYHNLLNPHILPVIPVQTQLRDR